MEGNLNLVPSGGTYEGSFDLQESIRFNQQQQQQQHSQLQGTMLHPSIHDVFPPLSMGALQDCCRPVSLTEYNETSRGMNVGSGDDEDEPSLMEDGGNQRSKGGKGGSVWHRVKWTDQMVKLLITAVSYAGQDALSGYGCGGRVKSVLIHKKGKWKSISRVMAERGFFVSPQQCEDKFNDLNKRYKRLNDILGRGTSCQVVEKPELLNVMDHISEKLKEDVRKILSSKQLFYEEMCSYHNGNRLHLPHDPALQRSLHLALEESDGRRKSTDDCDEENRGGESDDCGDFGECQTALGPAICGVMTGSSAKRSKHDLSSDEISFGNAQDVCKNSQMNPLNVHIDMNQACIESSKSAFESQMIESCSLSLEEKKIKIRMEMLELEKQRLKWQKFSQKKDRELEKMRLENENLKLENESMALELKRKELSLKRD